MNTDEEAVARANQEFYLAFESLEIARMEKCWLRENYVQCFHPGWGILRGWDPVMTSWRRIFENTPEMSFVLTEPRVEVRGSLAWVTLYENISSRMGEETIEGVVVATNVFEKRDGKWLMILHHGSSLVRPPSDPEPSTVH